MLKLEVLMHFQLCHVGIAMCGGGNFSILDFNRDNFLSSRLSLKFKVLEFCMYKSEWGISISASPIFSLHSPFPTFYVHEYSLLMTTIYNSKLFLATFMNKTQ